MSENNIYRVQSGDSLWSIYVGDAKEGDPEYQGRVSQWAQAANEAAEQGRDPNLIYAYDEQRDTGDVLSFSDAELANLPQETQTEIAEQAPEAEQPGDAEDPDAEDPDAEDPDAEDPDGEDEQATDSDATPLDHVNALTTHWDEIRGGDNILSKDDLEAIREGNAPHGVGDVAWDEFKEQEGGRDFRAVQDAAEYFLDNPDEFRRLDGMNGSSPDDKISSEEFSAYAAELRDEQAPEQGEPQDISELSDDEVDALVRDHAGALYENWDSIGDDDKLSAEDFEAIVTGNPPHGVDAAEWAQFMSQNDGAEYQQVRDAAQFFLDNPDTFNRIDAVKDDEEPDGTGSKEDFEIYLDRGEND